MTYTCFCTVCQIIPPNILEQMAKSDDPAIRDMALANIAAAEIARQQRAQLAATRAQPAALFFGTAPKKRVRVVHDARRKPDLDGPVRRREGDKATKDAEVDEAYKHSGTVHAFYRTVFKRNSIGRLHRRQTTRIWEISSIAWIM